MKNILNPLVCFLVEHETWQRFIQNEMTCRVGNFDALTYLTVTMRTLTNSFEKALLVEEKSRNTYFFRNAFCMRKDELYHKIFYA